MFVQQGHAAEGPRAGDALVLLHLGVGLQVRAQVGAIGEGPVTVLTGERALTCKERSGSVTRCFKDKQQQQNTPPTVVRAAKL